MRSSLKSNLPLSFSSQSQDKKSGLRKQADLHLNVNQNVVLLLQTCFLNIVAALSTAEILSLYN